MSWSTLQDRLPIPYTFLVLILIFIEGEEEIFTEYCCDKKYPLYMDKICGILTPLSVFVHITCTHDPSTYFCIFELLIFFKVFDNPKCNWCDC